MRRLALMTAVLALTSLSFLYAQGAAPAPKSAASPKPAATAKGAPPAQAGQPTSPPCTPAAGLNFICGIQAPEDLALIPNTRWLITSGMAAGSGLHLVDTQRKSAQDLFSVRGAVTTGKAQHDKAAFPQCPGPVDAVKAEFHGLALRARGTGYRLYATHHGGRESVEVFDIDVTGVPAATWVGCVPMPAGLSANSVAAFNDGTILATVLTLPGKTFEQQLAKENTGVVLQWTPGSPAFRQLPGTELPGNNGIETSADDKEFFVVSSGAKKVVAFARANPGTQLRTAQLAAFAPDNVHRMADGRLIAAGMIDDEPACGGAPKTFAQVQCARGWMAATIDPATMKVTQLAGGPRYELFSGTATALPIGNDLWLGAFRADRLAWRPLR